MIFLYVFIFLLSFALLFFSGKIMIKSLINIARFLGWKEFVVAFIVVAVAGSIPDLFVGITSALQGIPELSFGSVVGSNIIHLTLVVSLAALLSRGRGLPAESKMVQNSAVFTTAVAILPIILILDGNLSRGDGLVLIFCFFFYMVWLFSKKERFCKVYGDNEVSAIKGFKGFIKDIWKSLLGIFLLLVAAQGIVASALFFAHNFNLSIPIIGIFLVAFGNSIPEIYFCSTLARKGEGWMILGDLMGSVIIISTLVLGIVALINPIEAVDFSAFAVGRIFLILAAVFFVIFVRTDKRISVRESLFLLLLYIIFVIVELSMNQF